MYNCKIYIVIVFLSLILGCATKPDDYKSKTAEDIAKQEEKILQREDEQLWEKTIGIDTKEAYEEYIKKYPEGLFAEKAWETINANTGDADKRTLLDRIQVVKTGEKERVVFRGQEHKLYNKIGWEKRGFRHRLLSGDSIVLSPDGQHIAYVAKVDNGEVVVLDGKEGKVYDSVPPPHALLSRKKLSPEDVFIFSLDSRHLTYIARVLNKDYQWREIVVTDGLESRDYEEIRYGPVYTSDGKLVYMALGYYNPDVKRCFILVVDDKESGKYKEVMDFQLTKNEKHFAFIASLDSIGHRFLVLDGNPQGTDYKDIKSVIFSPDGKHFAYIGYRYKFKGGTRVACDAHLIVDGKEIMSLNSKRGDYNYFTIRGMTYNNLHFSKVRKIVRSGVIKEYVGSAYTDSTTGVTTRWFNPQTTAHSSIVSNEHYYFDLKTKQMNHIDKE